MVTQFILKFCRYEAAVVKEHAELHRVIPCVTPEAVSGTVASMTST